MNDLSKEEQDLINRIRAERAREEEIQTTKKNWRSFEKELVPSVTKKIAYQINNFIKENKTISLNDVSFFIQCNFRAVDVELAELCPEYKVHLEKLAQESKDREARREWEANKEKYKNDRDDWTK